MIADAGHYIPADLTVSGTRPASTTRLDGSRIEHAVTYTDRDFTTEGLKELAAPRGSVHQDGNPTQPNPDPALVRTLSRLE